MALTEAQKKAQANWEEKNKKSRHIINMRSATKKYISKHATIDEMIFFLESFANSNSEYDLSKAIHELKIEEINSRML